jgi:transglutaminase-like putative cysteine protease
MKPPPFLLGAALLVWGWQTGLSSFALLMAVVLESARWIDWRVEFTVKDFNRVVDLVSLLAAVGGIYCVLTREATNQVMGMFQAASFNLRPSTASAVSQTTFIYFQWFPMMLFPIVAALTYSTSEQYPRSCFFMLARRRAARSGQAQPATPGIQLGYPYLAVVLFSASLANQRSEWFYFAVVAAVAAALWVTRPKRFSTVIWIALLILVAKAGYLGHRGLNQLQTVLENKVATWVSSWARRSGDRSEAFTAIGKIGQLKLSGKIVLRVEAENGPIPPLLRDTTFNRFESPRWSNNPKSVDQPVIASLDDVTVWPMLFKPATNSVRISAFATRGQAVLVGPPGTAILQNLPVGELKTNEQGVIRATGAPDFLHYLATYGPGASVQSLPILQSDRGPLDLYVPAVEQPALREISEVLNLRELPEAERVRAVQQFFTTHFRYGSFLPSSLDQVPKGKALEFFLLKTRVGHCEYFATATALLLRQVGIPARYVYGWSVQEPEDGSKTFIVRERHAHAWCIYWSEAEKAWIDLDTTPSDWAQTENQNSSIWEPLSDRWSRAWFSFSKWRWYGVAGEWQNYLLTALVSLIGILAWRVLARQRRRQRSNTELSEEVLHRPGTDSEFYGVEARLAELGFGRREGEALGDWLSRVTPLTKISLTPLPRLLELHYRLRFDPNGLPQVERQALRDGVVEWLATAKAT